MAERGQFACDDSETAATMHAGEFPGPYTVRKNYLARHDGATWRLTELSNVVAYACRHSPTRIDIMATAQPFFGRSQPATNVSATNVFPAEPPPSAIAQSVASNLAHHPELHSIRRRPLFHRRHGRRSDDCDTVHRGTRIIDTARRWTLFRLSSVGLVASAGHAITVGPIMPRTRVDAGHGARLFAAIGGVAIHLFSHPLGSVG